MQSQYILAYLLIGFIVFITLKGEIPAYKAAVFGAAAATPSSSSTTAPTTGT